jgi:hypothetical protein
MVGGASTRLLLSLAGLSVCVSPTWSYWRMECTDGSACTKQTHQCCQPPACHSTAPKHCVVKLIPASDRISSKALLTLAPLYPIAIDTVVIVPAEHEPLGPTSYIRNDHPPAQISPEEVLAPRGPPARFGIA